MLLFSIMGESFGRALLLSPLKFFLLHVHENQNLCEIMTCLACEMHSVSFHFKRSLQGISYMRVYLKAQRTEFLHVILKKITF